MDVGATGKPDNPSYDGIKLHENEKAWTEDTFAKMKSWGFNSLGGWSDASKFTKFIPQDKRFPYFVVLHLGAYHKAPWNDLFDKETEKIVDDAAKKQILPIKNDQLLVGYFTDNELGWWGDTLFPSYLKFDAKAPGKQRLISLLREVYKNDFSKLKKDWTTDRTSFQDLLQPSEMKLIPGGNGIQVVHKWVYTLSRHYYSLMQRTVRKYDKNHMILGDRYAQYFDLDVVHASKGLVDVVSSNLGSDWLDGSYSHFYLDTLYRIVKKPTVITEFYFAAEENNTGNRNTGTAFPKVQTQIERAKGFQKCIQTFAEHPNVVGAHWFQYYDEPPKGRGDGEDFNMGMLDIYGKPYPLMVEVAQKSKPAAVHAKSVRKAIKPAIPLAPDNPLANRLADWNRTIGYIPSKSIDQWGDLYVCHDKESLYVGLLAMEYFDESLYAKGSIPEIDRPRLKLNLNGKVVDVRFNGKKQIAHTTPSLDLNEWGGLKHVIAIRIPLSSLNVKGHRLDFKASLWSHGRGRKMVWDQQLKFL